MRRARFWLGLAALVSWLSVLSGWTQGNFDVLRLGAAFGLTCAWVLTR